MSELPNYVVAYAEYKKLDEKLQRCQEVAELGGAALGRNPWFVEFVDSTQWPLANKKLPTRSNFTQIPKDFWLSAPEWLALKEECKKAQENLKTIFRKLTPQEQASVKQS